MCGALFDLRAASPTGGMAFSVRMLTTSTVAPAGVVGQWSLSGRRWAREGLRGARFGRPPNPSVIATRHCCTCFGRCFACSPPSGTRGKESLWLSPACTGQCWSRQTRHGLGGCIWMRLGNGTSNSPVSGTANPRSSQTGQVIRGLCWHNQNTFGPTEGQNEQWREANSHRQRQTIRYRGLVPTPPPPLPPLTLNVSCPHEGCRPKDQTQAGGGHGRRGASSSKRPPADDP